MTEVESKAKRTHPFTARQHIAEAKARISLLVDMGLDDAELEAAIIDLDEATRCIESAEAKL